ncbi:MAG: hypothetical protein ACRC7O_18345 [Fimbriiglobus sp.]
MTETVTTIVITDPQLLAQLAAAHGPIHFRGPSGELVKSVSAVPYGKLPPGITSPFTDAEIEAARKEPSTGLPLAEVWKRILSGEVR